MIAAMFDEAEARDPQHLRTWVVLVDGAEHQLSLIKAEAARRSAAVHVIIDLCRARNYADAGGRRCREAVRGRAS